MSLAIHEESIETPSFDAAFSAVPIDYAKSKGSLLSSQPTCKERLQLDINHPFKNNFFQNDANIAKARAMYLKAYIGGIFLTTFTIFAIFSIFWGVVWETPVRPLDGIVVDFDGETIGLNVTVGVLSRSDRFIKWTTASASEFPAGVEDLIRAIKNNRAWIAVAINEGSTDRLNGALLSADATYNGADAVTAYAAEARSENAYRGFIRPSVTSALDSLSIEFALQLTQKIASSSNLVSLMSTSPQTIVTPISYTLQNVLPFSQPVATAATFVGLIFNLILSFFIVMVGYGAREASGLAKSLKFRSLVALRLTSSAIAYFIISLFYSLLNKAFQLDTSTSFGKGGFMILWMVSWLGMLAVGLALESVITLLTHRFIMFFLLFWIITNLSVCIQPIEVLPSIYRYGYAIPFYNISHAIRTISMGTKNQVSLNFGVLIAWILVSCTTLPIFQWFIRRIETKRYGQQEQEEVETYAVDEEGCRVVEVQLGA